MNGSHFLESVTDIGYTWTKGLTSQSFDWMFEKEEILPFLEWVCNSLGSSNMLSNGELKQFDDLGKRGHILIGQQLDEALKSIESSDGEYLPSDEDIRKDSESLEHEIMRSKKWKEQLIKQRNQLSVHNTSLGHRQAQIGKLEAKAKQYLVYHLQRNQSDNDTYDTCLKNLATSVSELSELYHRTAADDQRPSASASFLSQISLDEYHQAESKFTRELNKYTKKQFFEIYCCWLLQEESLAHFKSRKALAVPTFRGIADMAGQNEGRRYDILEISDPSSLLIKGENVKVSMADCKELARLQTIYPKSEYQRIDATVEEKSLTVLCNYVKDQSHSLMLKPYPSDVEELRLHNKQKIVSKLKQELTTSAEDHVPRLLRESATSQVNRILQGDYDLKVARQDYFILNQDKVLDQLIIQRSRYELLTMAYEIEGRNHCDTHRILTATSLELKKTLLDLEEREEVMKNNPGHASQTMQRETIDSRDSFMVALHKVLGNPNHHQQLFLTYSSLQDAANNIEDEVLAARTSVATISTAKDQRMADLERQLKIYEKVLYSGSSTSKGLPQLSSPQLVDMMTRLEAMLSRLETTIRDTITDVEQKKKILKSDPLQIKGRNLFVFFMNDFAMLQQAMVEIETRWEANRVSTERQ